MTLLRDYLMLSTIMYVTDSPRVCCWALAGVCAADIPLLLTVAFCEHVLFVLLRIKHTLLTCGTLQLLHR